VGALAGSLLASEVGGAAVILIGPPASGGQSVAVVAVVAIGLALAEVLVDGLRGPEVAVVFDLSGVGESEGHGVVPFG